MIVRSQGPAVLSGLEHDMRTTCTRDDEARGRTVSHSPSIGAAQQQTLPVRAVGAAATLFASALALPVRADVTAATLFALALLPPVRALLYTQVASGAPMERGAGLSGDVGTFHAEVSKETR
jgi:hypothetical protein